MGRPVGSGERFRVRRGAAWSSWTTASAWAVSAALGAAGLLAMAAGLVDLLGDGDDSGDESFNALVREADEEAAAAAAAAAAQNPDVHTVDDLLGWEIGVPKLTDENLAELESSNSNANTNNNNLGGGRRKTRRKQRRRKRRRSRKK